MPGEASLCFYDIDECGYYDDLEELRNFGDITSLMEQLETWAKHGNKPVQHTATFGVHKSILPVYFGALARHAASGDYLFSAWNSTPVTAGRMASLKGDEPVERAQVVTSKVPENGIPGFATYFWIVPEYRMLATVRFSNPIAGHPGLSLYFKSFLERYSPHVVREVSANGSGSTVSTIKGYVSAQGDPPQEFRPSFKSSLKKRSGKIDEIRERRHLIRRVIRRSRLDMAERPNRAFFQRARRSLGLPGPPQPSMQKAKFESQIQMTPTEDELEAIIEKWALEKDQSWNDVGFEFRKESRVLWLNKAAVRLKAQVNVEHSSPHFVDVQSLLNQLCAQRQALLSAANSGA